MLQWIRKLYSGGSGSQKLQRALSALARGEAASITWVYEERHLAPALLYAQARIKAGRYRKINTFPLRSREPSEMKQFLIVSVGPGVVKMVSDGLPAPHLGGLGTRPPERQGPTQEEIKALLPSDFPSSMPRQGYQNFAVPGYSLASTREFDEMVSAMKRGAYEVVQPR